MEPQEFNNGVAKIMGIKSLKVGAVRVEENHDTKEVRVTVTAYATKGQIVKMKALLVEHLQDA